MPSRPSSCAKLPHITRDERAIDRFSEDIDITVFHSDVGQSASIDELKRLTRNKLRT